MKVAVIGCGLIGGIYARVIRDLGHDVAAVVDLDPDRARAVAESASARAYGSADEMFAVEKDVAAAGISTPPSLHPALVGLCASRGISTLCEKPLALDLVGAEEALRECRRYGTRLAIGFKMRFEPLFRRTKDLIDAGTIGRLRHLHLTHYQPMHGQAWGRAEGVTLEVLAHAVDLSRWLFAQEPTAVQATLGGFTPEGGDGTSRVRLVFGPDRDAGIAGGWLPDYPAVGGRDDHTLLAVGEQGYIRAVRPGSLTVHAASGQVTETVGEADYDGPFAREWSAFFSLLAGGDPGDLAIEADALAVQRILETVRTSHQGWSR
ncbi:Gfo/Idh/MocA family protein [Occultella gossypii]|uniref:Gfo/Idh/MocA family oxidoreductase n=1 Tax=Occultella gossypii TaxID=2800820 RepID=A0ABS7S2Y3_9MICO|nr:Gfo/Idh/MocA family oxidoreductase [Occultella gossypii]MBZ2194675.1 Gfo/Idh/MocA family oxidoreductase [Occultella gossypii]